MEIQGDLSGFGHWQVLADSEGAQIAYEDDLDMDVESPG